MRNVVIAGYTRSPFAPARKGELAKVRPDEMVRQVIAAMVERTGLNPEEVEDLVMGCSFPEAEQGLNIGRVVGLMVGFPDSVAGVTVNRFCGSSMESIHSAAGAIQMNAGEVFVAAGIESMTRVPMMGYNPMPHPAFAKERAEAYMSMGLTAENVAKKYNISREAQEKFALSSQQKAAAAASAGKFDDEIVPIKDGDRMIDRDGCIRPDTTLEGLAGLKPAFDEKGTVTAGTSSPLADGAVANIVCTEEYAEKNGLEALARIKSIAVAGCPPEIMGIGPVPSSRKALERAGLSIDDMDIIEVNEAFASQSLAVVEDLGIDTDKLNIDGGAIALGHPLGASGGRITGKAASLLRREGGKYALATMCIGGGQGIATVLEAV